MSLVSRYAYDLRPHQISESCAEFHQTCEKQIHRFLLLFYTLSYKMRFIAC
jgi:hypothetical protein